MMKALHYGATVHWKRVRGTTIGADGNRLPA
jgi:hypothetical protein